MALSSITNNPLLQQQALQSQLTPAQQAASTTTPTDTAAPTAPTATVNPAAALVSGNAALTSDLLSVLLNEQQSSTSSGGNSGTTLAGILNQQDIADQNGSAADTQQDPQVSLLSDIDAAAVAQSASSTDNVLSGLQDLLAQLSV